MCSIEKNNSIFDFVLEEIIERENIISKEAYAKNGYYFYSVRISSPYEFKIKNKLRSNYHNKMNGRNRK